MSLVLMGHVDAEGGPLLLADFEVAREWHGIERGGGDYERACAFFDVRPGTEGGELPVGEGKALLWEMAGPGTAFVLRGQEDELVIVRTWPRTPDADSEMLEELAMSPADSINEIGSVRIESGAMVVFWATEDGSEISAQASTRGGVVVARLPAGTYGAWHEVTACSAGSARRLRIKPKPAPLSP